MAELEEIVIENLREWIFDENKIVTFKWLSLMLSMHVNQSKRILEDFVKLNKDKPGCQLSVVYCVSGFVLNSDFEVYKVELVTEESLKNVEAMFIPPVSSHIYSVQRSAPKNLANLYIADYDLMKENIFSSNKFSAIQCPSARMRTLSNEEVPLKRLNEEGSSVLIKKEEKAKPSAARKRASSFFDRQNRKAVATSNGSSSVSSEVEKPGPLIPEQSKPSTNISLCGQNNMADNSVPNAKSSHVENRKEKPQKVSEKENRTGKRKRLRIAEMSSSEEDETEEQDMRIEIGEEEMNWEDEDVKVKPVADIVEPVQATATEASQKKSTKKLVSRTSVNDEGFMVTEKVWETCEVMDVSEDKAATKPPVQKSDVAPAAAAHSSTVQKSDVAPAAAAHSSTMSKKKTQPQKGNKQTSLMKFFNKQ